MKEDNCLISDLYETDDFDYTKLARLHDQMAEMYRAIVDKNQMRMEPQYYRVSFWGKNHPAVIQNKTFVYRGKPRGTEDVPARYTGSWHPSIVDFFVKTKSSTIEGGFLLRRQG